MRFFNTAGPVNCADHYCLSPLDRFDLFEIENLISQKKYFILHAPRQTGKTTSMLALVDHLNEKGDYKALYCNVETAQTAREDVRRGMQSILVNIFENSGRHFGEQFYWSRWKHLLSEYGEDTALKIALNQICAKLDRPLVLVIDEIDSLVGDTLISVLRQQGGQQPGHGEASGHFSGVLSRAFRVLAGAFSIQGGRSAAPDAGLFAAHSQFWRSD